MTTPVRNYEYKLNVQTSFQLQLVALLEQHRLRYTSIKGDRTVILYWHGLQSSYYSLLMPRNSQHEQARFESKLLISIFSLNLQKIFMILYRLQVVIYLRNIE